MQRWVMTVWVRCGLALGFCYVDVYSPDDAVVTAVTFSRSAAYLRAIAAVEVNERAPYGQ